MVFLRKTLLWATLGLLVPLAEAAGDPWMQLKTGMARSEAVAVLGVELMASKGRGFEVAIYEGRAEVLFLHGQVVAWTAPASSEAAPAPENSWRFDQSLRARANVAPAARRTTAPRKNLILPAYRL